MSRLPAKALPASRRRADARARGPARRPTRARGRRKSTFYRYRRGLPLGLKHIALTLVALAIAAGLAMSLHRDGHIRPASRALGPSGGDPRAWLPGPMPTATPHTPLAIGGGPSLDATRLDALLAAYQSPLAGHGADLVALSRRYGIDDAVALAFFVMESRAGTQGEAVLTKSFGNLRPMSGAPALDGYRLYHSWLEGAAEWFRVLRTLYLDTRKLRTVDAVVPVYAPATDNNDPPTMIAGIYQLVRCWRGDPNACPADPPGVRALVTLPPPS